MNQPNSLQSFGAHDPAGISPFGIANGISPAPVFRSGVISINAGATALKRLVSKAS